MQWSWYKIKKKKKNLPKRYLKIKTTTISQSSDWEYYYCSTLAFVFDTKDNFKTTKNHLLLLLFFFMNKKIESLVWTHQPHVMWQQWII